MISKAKEVIIDIIVRESSPKAEKLKPYETGNIKRRVLGDLFLFRVD